MAEGTYQEIVCRRDVSGANFDKGIQDFHLDIGTPNVFIPYKSYFLMTLSISGSGGAANPRPLAKDGIAFADNAIANCFNNCYFKGGNQDVSSINQFLPQAAQAKSRLGLTHGWLQSMGDSSYIHNAYLTERINKVSGTNPKTNEIRQVYSKGVTDDTKYHTADVTIAEVTKDGAQPYRNTVNYSVLTGSNGADYVNAGISVGDTIIIGGGATVVEVFDVVDATTLNVTSLEVAEAKTTDYIIVKNYDQRSQVGKNRIMVAWQPPIGIFDYDEPLGSGQWKVQLNPDANYKSSVVESLTNNGTISDTAAATSYNINIEDLRFYAFIQKMSIPDDTRLFELCETLVQSKTITSNQTLEFTVPSSTYALAFWVQDNAAGTDKRIPPSMFKTLANNDLNLTQFQMTYANIVQPSTKWASSYASVNPSTAATASASNLLVQRYHDTMQEAKVGSLQAGCETLDEWMQRGPLMYYRFDRDRDNLSSQVQVQLTYSAMDANAKGFLCAFFHRSVSVTTSHGLITNIVSMAI